MKNTKMSQSKGDKAEVLGREILYIISLPNASALPPSPRGIFVFFIVACIWVIYIFFYFFIYLPKFSFECCLLFQVLPFHFLLRGTCSQFIFLVEVGRGGIFPALFFVFHLRYSTTLFSSHMVCSRFP